MSTRPAPTRERIARGVARPRGATRRDGQRPCINTAPALLPYPEIAEVPVFAALTCAKIVFFTHTWLKHSPTNNRIADLERELQLKEERISELRDEIDQAANSCRSWKSMCRSATSLLRDVHQRVRSDAQ